MACRADRTVSVCQTSVASVMEQHRFEAGLPFTLANFTVRYSTQPAVSNRHPPAAGNKDIESKSRTGKTTSTILSTASHAIV